LFKTIYKGVDPRYLDIVYSSNMHGGCCYATGTATREGKIVNSCRDVYNVLYTSLFPAINTNHCIIIIPKYQPETTTKSSQQIFYHKSVGWY